MVSVDILDKGRSHQDGSGTSSAFVSTRETFLDWIAGGNAKTFPPEVILSCLDKISEYALQKNISSASIWAYTRFSAFKHLYDRLCRDGRVWITDKSARPIFMVAGQLYLNFLKDELFLEKATVGEALVTVPSTKNEVCIENKGLQQIVSQRPEINYRDVVAWLVTQPNANGSLFLESVVLQYMSALRFAPAKLRIFKTVNRNVFDCHTVAALNTLWDTFTTASNYKQINASTSGAFSAGMRCLSRYLGHLTEQSEGRNADDEARIKNNELPRIASPQSEINYKDVVAWLVTQPNINGSLYLENVVLQYMGALRSAPAKLQIFKTVNRNVFDCHTVAELNALWDTFTAASNYKQINANTSGAFSAGMKCLSRYLEHLTERKEGNNSYKEVRIGNNELPQITSQQPEINYKDVIAWLVTQPNENRSQFLENVALQYMVALRSAPAMLQILKTVNRNVFDCHTIAELNTLWDTFITASNYKQINASTSGAFAAGMGCLSRYLGHLAKQRGGSSVNREESKFIGGDIIETDGQPNTGVLCTDFTQPERFPASLSGNISPSITLSTTASNSAFSDIVDFEDGREGLRGILNTHFQTLNGYSNINILWDAAQNRLSMFLNDNAINSADILWKFVNRVFNREFTLCAPHIWQTPPSYPQNTRGLIINLARQGSGVVGREQIDAFFTCVKINAPVNSVVLAGNEIFFYSDRKFIAAESVNLNVKRCEQISQALDNLFLREGVSYIVLRDIKAKWFLCLPELLSGARWTPLLLQEALRVRPEIGYRTETPIIKGQTLDTIRAAIMPNNSDILTFADVVHRFCYNKHGFPHEMTAEDLRLELRDAGFLEGNELIYNMHKALRDYRFAFTDENKTVMILER